ncbi:MAG: hypothetical protein KY444_04795 [Gemmatimonadetes bacterium]|nr:hypothetical protein [Gemmatimonadota bacterium]
MDERFWCARCQDWAIVRAERVEGLAVERDGAEPRLEPVAPENAPRQPLRVPPGWLIQYNEFLEVEPGPDWLTFADQFQARYQRRDRMLDVEWRRTDEHPDGIFRIVVYEGDFSGTLLHTYWSADRMEVVAEIERLMHRVLVGLL